jgi:hypothetical protein
LGLLDHDSGLFCARDVSDLPDDSEGNSVSLRLEKASESLNAKGLTPFWLTAAAWAALGVVLNFGAGVSGWGWFLAVWGACLVDFWVTAELLRRMLLVKGDEGTETAPIAATVVLGIAKVACLGLVGVVLWAGRNSPLRAILMGLSTLVVVPLLGGLWWYQKEKFNGDSRP